MKNILGINFSKSDGLDDSDEANISNSQFKEL
jgi:hypothetical protein